MRNPRKHQKPVIGIGIAALVAVLGLAALASDSARFEKPAAVDAEQYAEFIENEVFDVQDLAEGAEIQRRWFNRITPPGFSWVQPMFPSVAPFDAENFGEPFLDDLLGEDKNSVAIYPLSLELDPKTRETLVYNADGKLIAILPSDGVSRAWPEDADPARVVLQLDLLPSEDVEPYLYVEGRIVESAKARVSKPERSEGMVLRSLGPGEFGFAGAHRLTNGQMRLTATNGTDVAEIYSYTVWHTSTVVVTVWTNEYDEVVTSTNLVWDPVSPPYAGIESAWACQTTNLVLSGGVGTWDDADVSTNARVRFYAAAKRMDSDGDGLTDGAEIFLHRTDPGLPDSDGDGVGDGVEVGQGGDPLDPAEYPVDPDLEAALAGINVAQIGYLSFLCDQFFAYDLSTNYAQRIQTLREALAGLAESFLDLDVNVDGVLAERTNVVVWTLDTVLSSTGNYSGDWLEGLATTSQVEEIAAVLGQLTHLVYEGSTQTGYPHQGVVTQAAPFMVVSPWDLGTGYPEDWPTNQTIKTYLLLDTKIDIPYVGPGTVDDWIEVNGTARFPGSGEIYTNHVAEISAPTWDPAGNNRLELWDCGDCAGPNDYAYLSPFKVVQVLEAPVLKVEFKELWETSNRVNQIFNPTKKDDKSADGYQEVDSSNDTLYGIHREKLYVVSSDENQYAVSLDLNIQPVSFRSQFVVAAYMNGTKVNGSDTPVPAQPDAQLNMTFTDPSSSAAATDFAIKAGFDANGNGTIDSGEMTFDPEVYKYPDSNLPRYATVFGINKTKYDWHHTEINKTLTAYDFDPGEPDDLAIYARSFLYMFMDGNDNGIRNDLKPTTTAPSQMDTFQQATSNSSCFSEWLTHNSGAAFSDQGVANIPQRVWNDQTRVAQFFAQRSPLAPEKAMFPPGGGYIESQTQTGAALEQFYDNQVKPTAEALLQNQPVDSTVTMPQGGGFYHFPNQNCTLFSSESSSWVPAATIRVGEGNAYGGKWGSFLSQFLGGTSSFDEYDAAGTIGRGRILDPRCQFTVKKVEKGIWPVTWIEYEVISVRLVCEIADLYDFNYEDSELASHAAAHQIGYGNGNNGRGHGFIYRDNVVINYVYDNPFEQIVITPP